jgi:hypothetical protein
LTLCGPTKSVSSLLDPPADPMPRQPPARCAGASVGHRFGNLRLS